MRIRAHKNKIKEKEEHKNYIKNSILNVFFSFFLLIKNIDIYFSGKKTSFFKKNDFFWLFQRVGLSTIQKLSSAPKSVTTYWSSFQLATIAHQLLRHLLRYCP